MANLIIKLYTSTVLILTFSQYHLSHYLKVRSYVTLIRANV